jgi:RsiW-degrading membrane proteinase PrsW (M82 family)
MKYLIIIHLVINATILFWYMNYKQEKIKNIWKEVITTILIGWIVVFMADDE